jgi:hypothetical protein
MSPEAEALVAILERQLGPLLDRAVISIPEAGRVLGCTSDAAAYARRRQGRLPGLVEVSDDRFVVSTVQLCAFLFGQANPDLPAHRGEGAA